MVSGQKRKAITVDDIRKLPKKQRDVLGHICINQDGGHHQATLAALEKRGLIASYDEERGGHPPMTVKRWGVPIDVHMAWCEWCSEQPDEDM